MDNPEAGQETDYGDLYFGIPTPRTDGTADPASGQTSLPLDAEEPEIDFPAGPRDWMRYIRSLDLSGIGTRPAQDTARLILGELAACVGWTPEADNYGKAWPSVDAIADKIKRGRRQVCRIMRRLEQAGHVDRIEQRRPDGGYTSNLYALKPAKSYPQSDKIRQGGICQKPAFMTGGDLSKTRIYDRSIRTEERTETHEPARGDSYKNDSSPEARKWLQEHGVRAVSLARVANDNPTLWRRVRAHVDGSNGKYGAGAIVKMLREEMDVPERQTYTSPALPCGCAKGYCIHANETTEVTA